MIMKSDTEPAMIQVREAIGVYHGVEIIPESPPRGESGSNGRAEEAGKSVREMMNVYKDHIEYKADIEIGPEDVILQWIARWAAMAYTRYKRGKDGKTPYERKKGKPCREDVLPIGEKVMYKKLHDSGEKKKSMEAKLEEGIWLGQARASNDS